MLMIQFNTLNVVHVIVLIGMQKKSYQYFLSFMLLCPFFALSCAHNVNDRKLISIAHSVISFAFIQFKLKMEQMSKQNAAHAWQSTSGCPI